MGTRSTIALEFADGTVQQVYCHWDGYLEHNGAILKEHYLNPFKLRDLIDLGDLSSLRPEIGDKHPFSQFGLNKEDPDFDEQIALYEKAEALGWSTFYGRERGEDCPARKYANVNEYFTDAQQEEYDYILREVCGTPVWFVRCYATDGAWVTIPQAEGLIEQMNEEKVF
jgi:hypothetical protein